MSEQKLKPSDLRIGNYVYHVDTDPNGEKEHKVKIKWDFECWVGLNYGEINFQDLDPIPLTEEWLSKFGFDGDNMDRFKVLPFGNSTEIHVDCVYPGEFINICITSGRTKWVPGTDYQYIYLNEIRYVHQLQNLFLSLTGEELEIKI